MAARLPAALLVLLPPLVFIACAPGERRVAIAAAGPSTSVEPSPAPRESPPNAAPSFDLARLAAAAWAARADPQQLERAIVEWEQLLATRPDDQDVQTHLAEAYAESAVTLAHSSATAQAAAFARGVRAAAAALLASSPEFRARIEAGDAIDEALDVLPNEALPAVFWYADNLAGYALARGLAAAVYVERRFGRLLAFVLARDDGFHHGAAHRLYGSYLARAPAAAGGDLSKARVEFERALALAPACLSNKVSFAEDYAVAAKDRGLFERLLTEVADDGGTDTPERLIAKKRARQLLASADQLF